MKSFLLFLLFSTQAFAGDFVGPFVIIPMTAVSGSQSVVSIPIDIRSFKAYSLQTEYTGTLTGTFAVQGSLDYNLPGVASPTWDTLSGVSLTAPSGSPGGSIADVGNTGVPWVRVNYTNASGNGNLEVLGHAKGH